MRRVSLGMALVACAIAAAGCSGGSKPAGTTASGAAKGVYGVYYYLAVPMPIGGNVKSGDGLINCGNGGASCGDAKYFQTKYAWGTQVVLTATAAAGYEFQEWTGDCKGTEATCTLDGLSAGTDYTVGAVFKDLNAPKPPPNATPGRIYGYVKDGSGKGAAGVSVVLSDGSKATTTATGAYTFEVAPGAYTLSTAANAQFQAAGPVDAALPAITDSACVKGFYVPTAPATEAGCLLKLADVVVAADPTYVAPALPTVTASKNYLAGFGQAVTLNCTAAGTNTFVKWVQTAGPTAVDTSSWAAAGATFTTPAFGDLVAATATANADTVNCPNRAGNAAPNKAVGCGVSNLVPEGRLGFVSFNKQQAGEMTYTFQCQTTDGAKTLSKNVTVQLASFVSANTATMVRETPQPLSATQPTVFNNQTAGQPPVQGPLWGAQSEQFTTQIDQGTWRAHDSVVVPAGTILVADDVKGRASYDWKFCGTAKSTYASCAAIPGTVLNVPVINDANTPNPWFPVTWTAGKTLYLVNAAMPLPGGKAAIPVKASTWTGYEAPAPAESCKECHSVPGLKLVPSATYPNGGGDDSQIAMEIAQGLSWCPDKDNCYERGPTIQLEEYENSKHAGILRDGGSGTHYSSSCLPCHTLGYDPAVTNNGWDDVAGTLGYKLPDFPFEGATKDIFLANMPVELKTLSNVQCDSCHGPAGGGPNHTASLNSRMCSYCHDGGHHSIYSQWTQSAHANLAGAQGEGPSHGRDQTHCGRCHFAQGFTLYAAAVKSGNPDKLGNPPPVGAPAGAKTSGILCSPATVAAGDTCPNGQQAGLITNENVEAISCQTCHEPHSLELRIKGEDTVNGLVTAGGFQIKNGGAGAICSVCHNSRNGIVGALSPNPNNSGAPYAGVAGVVMAHNDATPLTADSTKTTPPAAPPAALGIGTPHAAAQADVYYAGNGYLLGQPMPAQPNYHADPNWFADTCAECHVKRFTAATQGKTVVNHTFGVDNNTCVGCHGGGNELTMRENFVNDQFANYLASLKKVLNGAGIVIVNGQLNGAMKLDTTTGKMVADIKDYTVPAGVTITDVAVVEASRALGFTLSFSNGDVLKSCSIDKIFSDAAKTQPTLYTQTSATVKTYGNVAKSMYNYFLIKNDKSSGVHNIPFVDAMLDAMVNHLDSTGLPK